jgi:hypothetical protein
MSKLMRVEIGSREKEERRGDEEEDRPLAEASREGGCPGVDTEGALAIVLQAIVLCHCLIQQHRTFSTINHLSLE